MTNSSFDAAIFDLDGVITKTASVHSAAWKQMFDEFLKLRAEKTGEPFQEFTHTDDYLPYVDGKPRYKGVASFLDSREIELPFGDPSDEPGDETVCGLGNRKNELFNEMIRSGNVDVFQSTVDFIHELKGRGIRIGVASSSKNCKTILEAAGLLELFETRVDGLVSADLHLQGKPEPDIFTTAADNLGVTYDRTIIIEDALSGVQAGMKGNFGLVLGVARENNELELKKNGADIIVQDVGEITIKDIEAWFRVGLEDANWSVSYYDYIKEEEGTRETLLTVGNGCFGTRGTLEECTDNGVNYPGTYIAGVYNRLNSTVAGKVIVNEDFVNCPNWLPISFCVDNGNWFDPNRSEVVSIFRKLDFRSGLLKRELVVRDDLGRETLVTSSRLASMAHPHLAALKYCLTPLNYSGKISIRSGLDGDIKNGGVERYRDLGSKHLEPLREGVDEDFCFIEMRTNQSKVRIVEAAMLRVYLGDQEINPDITFEQLPGEVWSTFGISVTENETLQVEKIISIHSSMEDISENPIEKARATLTAVESFDTLLQSSAEAWEVLWKKMDIRLLGDRSTQKLIRLNLYHTLVTASPLRAMLDVGIPARGLHGEAYRGHIFWDELYILPLYNLHFPEVSRSALKYRHRRLDHARKSAQDHGYRGAMFPWQSGSDGREETQVVHLNPISGEWGPDHSSLQRHVSLAIAYNIWHYYWVTGDREFMGAFGAEMFLDICRFWASKAQLNPVTGRYSIDKVMGPDEYHEKYPDTKQGGLRNNSYSNIMTSWLFSQVPYVLASLDETEIERIQDTIMLEKDELNLWEEIRRNICISITESGNLEQFEGYFDLGELDWDEYRSRYGNIHRMDRILKAEGKSPDQFKVSKQADVLMAFFVLETEGVANILSSTGYSLDNENLLARNFEYYLRRTSHGSTLSKLVHSYLAGLIGDCDLAWAYYQDALRSDFIDIQGGTTKEGIHTGVMAGSAHVTLRSFAGLRLDRDRVHIDPHLPRTWRELQFNIQFRGDHYEFVILPDMVKIRLESSKWDEIELWVQGCQVKVLNQQWVSIELT